MRHYPIIPLSVKQWRLWYNYIYTLDRDLWSLYDYMYTFNPNYVILNNATLIDKDGTSNSYYTIEELQQLKLIQPVYFYLDKAELDIPPVKPNGLLIFPSYLPRHKGIIHNFNTYDLDKIFLFFGSRELIENKNSSGRQDIWYLDFNLFHGNQLDNIVQLQNNNGSVPISSDVRFRLWANEQSFTEELTPSDVRIATNDNNYIVFSEEGNVSFQKHVMLFEESFIIVREKDVEDHFNIAKNRASKQLFLYARFTPFSPFYIPSNFVTTHLSSTQSQTKYWWKYNPRGEEDYGTNWYYNMPLSSPRFTYLGETKWADDLDVCPSKRTFHSFSIVQNQIIPLLCSMQPAADASIWDYNTWWSESCLLNYDLTWRQEETDGEILCDNFIIDNTFSVSRTNIANQTVPTYTITIKNENKFAGSAPVYINLW